MNRFITHIKFLLVSCLLLATACSEDFLDKQPSDQPANDTFFKSETELILALDGAYEGLYWESAATPYPIWFDSSTDISFNRGDYAGMYTVQTSEFSTETETFYSIWSALYTRIARCNNLLANMHKAQDVVSEETYQLVEAQAKTLRAFFYMYLVNLYGDVPFVTNMISLEDARQATRTSRAEIMETLYADLDFAASVLPPSWSGDGNDGRITRGAANALKARIALYEGDYRIAADAAQEVIQSGEYTLNDNFSELFTLAGKGSEESILHVPYLRGIKTNGIPRYLGLRTTQGWSIIVPTQNIVDFFQCTDGKHIDESPLYNAEKPYEHRDPRLTHSILTPGQWFDGLLFENHPDSTTTLQDQGGQLVRVNNQEVTHAYASFTGYVWKKYQDPIELPQFTTQSEVDFIFIRYAEVLLTYAEAKIELDEIDASVFEAINEVRGRKSVEMPTVTAGSQDELRTLVRYERTVELALEGTRLFDIRRWKYAEHVLPGNTLGRKKREFYQRYPTPTIDEYGQSHYDNEDELFNVIGVNTFDASKNYLWPIPQKERDLNDLLSQNPNY